MRILSSTQSQLEIVNYIKKDNKPRIYNLTFKTRLVIIAFVYLVSLKKQVES